MLAGIAPHSIAQDRASFETIDLDTPVPLDKLAQQLAAKRVVFIGEIHDRYDHHLNQLEIIRRLHELDSNLAIGVEYFSRAVQAQVDDYIAGRSTEQEFLRAAQYYQSWGYDYRLYAPIFRYARDEHIPVRALNVPHELPSAVAKGGMANVPEKMRAYVPHDIQPADKEYRARLRRAFEEHQAGKPDAFDHFVDAQLIWDEGMAESAAEYLNANPERRMVILVGAGHVEFGSGIPSRLERRTHSGYAIVLSSGEVIEAHIADYVLLSKEQDLPPAGVLGTSLEDKDGECRVKLLTPGGAAEKASLKKGDVLTAIDGQMIKTVADVHLALWQKKPGDRVRVSLARKGKVREVEVVLSAPGGPGGHP